MVVPDGYVGGGQREAVGVPDRYMCGVHREAVVGPDGYVYGENWAAVVGPDPDVRRMLTEDVGSFDGAEGRAYTQLSWAEDAVDYPYS